MNKITKNYLKSFLKDLLISILMIIYLVFMFLVVNVISNTSIQYYEQYNKVLNNSHNWDVAFNNMFVKWNFEYIGDKTKDPNANKDNYKTFDFINNLKDEDGKKYLANDWYKILYRQTTDSNKFYFPKEGYVNIQNDARDNYNRLDLFTGSLNQDIKQFTLFQDDKKKDWKNTRLIFKNNKIEKYNLGDVFNPSADWEKVNYSLNNAITNKLGNINYNNKNNALGFNQTLLLENHYSSSDKTRNKQLDNPIGSSLTQIPNSELLSITFANNDKRNNMSEVFLQTRNSRMPKNDNEILVNQQFAKNKGLKIGDKINLFGSNKIKVSNKQKLTDKFYTIVGYGLSLSDSVIHNVNSDDDNDSRDSFSNSNYKYGSIYTTYNEFLNIKKEIYNGLSTDDKKESKKNQYSWYINSNGKETDKVAYSFNFINGYGLLAKPGIYNTLFKNIVRNNYININDINTFCMKWQNSYIYQQITNNKTKMIINFSIILFVSLFSFVFLNLIIKHDINNSERQLGIFKAMGYKTKELAWVYACKTLITFFIASIVGYLLSIPLQIYSTSSIFKQPISLTINSFNYIWWFLMVLFLAVSLLFTTISFFINLKYIKKSPIQLIYNNNIAKNVWLLKISKKIFSKARPIGKLKLAFSIQAFYKWLIIWIIFIFASVSLMLSSSAISSIGDLVKNDTLKNIYNDNVSTIMKEEQPHPNHIINNNGKLQTIFDIDDAPNKDPFLPLKPNNSQIQNSTNHWHKILSSLNIKEILTTKINDDPYINIYDFKNLINVISNKASLFESKFNIDKQLKLTLSYLYYNTLYNNADYNKSTIICLNRNLITPDSNYSFLTNSIISPLFSKLYNGPNIHIYGIDDSKTKANDNFENYKKYFELNGINENEFGEVLQYDKNSKEIPVIISKKVAMLFNWKEEETIVSNPNSTINNYSLAPFGNSNKKQSVNNVDLKIVGVSNNIYSADMTTSYKNIAKFYKDKNNKNYVDSNGKVATYSLDNTISSLDDCYPNERNLNNIAQNYSDFLNQLNIHSSDPENITRNPSINIKYFPIIIDNKILSTDATITKLLTDNTNVNWYNNFNTNITYLNQTKESINDIYGIIKKVQVINTLLTYILVGILIILSLALIIDENKQIIMLLKVVGYQNKKINWVATGNIIFVLLFSLIFGSVIAFIILKFIENIVWTKFHYLIQLPLSLSAVLQIALLAVILSAIIWKICMNLINNKKTEELARYD